MEDEVTEVDQEGRGVEVEHVSDISGTTSEASGNTGTKNKRITPNVGMSVCYHTHTHTHTHYLSSIHSRSNFFACNKQLSSDKKLMHIVEHCHATKIWKINSYK